MSKHKNPSSVFITGGMSGLGKSLAEVYLGRGANVAIFDLTVKEEVVVELKEKRRHNGQQVCAYAVSVTDFAALEGAVQSAHDAIGGPQLAINCAGILRGDPFETLSGSDFEMTVQINLFGSRNFAAAVQPLLKPGSRLALVSSLAGFVANYSYAAYNASKFAVIGLGRVLRLEWKPKGIDVSLICPPEVDTPLLEQEAPTMHPASRALKDMGGTLTLDEAIAGIVAGLDAGRHVIIPGFKGKVVYYGGRYLPDLFTNLIADRIVRSELTKIQRG